MPRSIVDEIKLLFARAELYRVRRREIERLMKIRNAARAVC